VITVASRVWVAAAAIGLAACGGASTTVSVGGAELPPAPEGGAATTRGAVDEEVASFAERMAAVDEAVAVWRDTSTIEAAHEAAEAAANLIVGPNGPDYGDRSGDGVVSGQSAAGLLPGLDGVPAGIAIPLSANRCVARDVLGGTWVDPGAEWGAMLAAIDEWRPDNNTMPTLASHPMRVVGWATFTLGSESLGEAHEYAGHAKLHVDISVRALDC
jgi:hypothetical protein